MSQRKEMLPLCQQQITVPWSLGKAASWMFYFVGVSVCVREREKERERKREKRGLSIIIDSASCSCPIFDISGTGVGLIKYKKSYSFLSWRTVAVRTLLLSS